jgi:hypothetical protein
MTDTTAADTKSQEAGTAAATPATPAGPVKTKFYFKSRKEMQKVVEDGKEVEKEVTIPKAAPVELVIPILTVNDVITILQSNDEKQIALLLESVNDVVNKQARGLVDEDPEKARKDGIDNSQLTWDFISKIPPATRRGGGIEDAVWEAFIKDYVDVMVHHGKPKDKAETGAKLLAKRFQPVKDQKNMVRALLDNLRVWFTNTEKGEDFQQVYESLTSKADTLLAKDEDALMASI